MNREFIPFELERMMSIWENVVEYNLSESGVHPITIEELVDDPKVIEDLLSTGLNYPQANGSIELRERIAALYKGATSNNVLVTVGAAQANYTTILTVLEPNDEILVMLPNYMQIWGAAQNLGFHVKTFTLREELDWGVDIDELERAVSNRTKLIAICNPNNPTGHILTADEMDAIVAAASRVGAWLLVDEVYAGTERLTDEFTPSFWGRYERVLAINSMSKAYGLPGLRIGWIVAPAQTAEEIWSRQDYITISATMLSNKLAAYALSPQVRPRILARIRKYIRKGYDNFERWFMKYDDLYSLIPPQAAAIAFVHYHTNINSTELCKRLIHEQKTFIVPGDHFGMDHHLRICYGLPVDYLNEGLSRLHQVIASSA